MKLCAVLMLSSLWEAGYQDARFPTALISQVQVIDTLNWEPEGVETIHVRFHMTLKNDTDRYVRLSRKELMQLSAEVLSKKGRWQTMYTSSWIGEGDNHFDPCYVVEPGKSFSFQQIDTQVVVKGETRARYPNVKVRFGFQCQCREGRQVAGGSFVRKPSICIKSSCLWIPRPGLKLLFEGDCGPGAEDQVAAAAWLFAELSKAPNASPAASYRMPVGDDEIRVFHTPNTKMIKDFMEVVVTARSIGNVHRMFTYNSTRAIAARGPAEQMALSEWLFQQLDRNPPGNEPSREYHLLNETENTVQVFYVPHVATQADLQKIATSVRTTTSDRQLYTCFAPRALAVRGTPSQAAVAAQLIADRTKTN